MGMVGESEWDEWLTLTAEGPKFVTDFFAVRVSCGVR